MGEILHLAMQENEQKLSDILDGLACYVRKLEEQNEYLRQLNEALSAENPNKKMLEGLPDVLMAQDIADYLHISRYKAYELLKISPEHGGIKSFELCGRNVRCMKEEFAQWLKQQSDNNVHGIRKQARER